MKTPIGTLRLCADEKFLCAVTYAGDAPPDGVLPEQPVLRQAAEQLREYFAGDRKEFTVPLRLQGTAFQCAVWQQLQKIPYGETGSYGQIAAQLGKPGAARAVGNACNKNNFLILIPCHRVCAAKNMGGFALDLKIKQYLLKLEKPVVMGFVEGLADCTKNSLKIF